MKFFVINGPNLNMLGIREPAIYGSTTYADLVRLVEQAAKELQVEVEILQSNHEGTLVDEIQRAYYEAMMSTPFPMLRRIRIQALLF